MVPLARPAVPGDRWSGARGSGRTEAVSLSRLTPRLGERVDSNVQRLREYIVKQNNPIRRLIGHGTPLPLTIALLVLLFMGPAMSGPVGSLTTFVNGEVADADQVNGNFEALRIAVDDNDARISALEGAGSSFDVDSYATGTRRGFITVPANGQVDLIPPANETWLVRSLAGTAPGANTTFGWADALEELTINNFGSTGLAGVAIAISDAGWLRFKDTSGNSFDIYYTATVVQAEHVFSLTDVASAATQEVRPPAGQVWFITNALSESQFADPKAAFTNGVNTAGPLVRNGVATAAFISIDNANYVTYTNTTGGAQKFLITGVRVP